MNSENLIAENLIAQVNNSLGGSATWLPSEMAEKTENVRNYALCLPLKKDLANQILASSKVYESRIARTRRAKLMNLKPADVLAFHWYSNERVTAKILQIQEFDSVQSMLQCIPRGQLIPGASLSLANETAAYEQMLNFQAGSNRMIVFKLGEPLYHSNVVAKTPPKKRPMAEVEPVEKSPKKNRPALRRRRSESAQGSSK